MTDWIARLMAKLDRLRRADPEFIAYGAADHWYRLGPKLTPSWVAWLEAKYGIELPEPYRRFLLEAGNGGAGPHNGLMRFGYIESPDQVPSDVGTGAARETEYPSGFRRGWEERYLPDGTPSDGFEVRFYDSMRMLAGGTDVLARPFPFTERSYANDRALEMLGGGTTGFGGRPRWNVPGALYVSLFGCGATQMLVLNGPWAGAIWMQDPGSDNGYHLESESFEAWYSDWLERGLEFCARSLNYRRLLSLFATADPSEARALEQLLRSRGIGCEVEAGKTTVLLVCKDQAEDARPLIDDFAARKRQGG
jgi:hypothetical protein